jgi:hypothetical protein
VRTDLTALSARHRRAFNERDFDLWREAVRRGRRAPGGRHAVRGVDSAVGYGVERRPRLGTGPRLPRGARGQRARARPRLRRGMTVEAKTAAGVPGHGAQWRRDEAEGLALSFRSERPLTTSRCASSTRQGGPRSRACKCASPTTSRRRSLGASQPSTPALSRSTGFYRPSNPEPCGVAAIIVALQKDRGIHEALRAGDR